MSQDDVWTGQCLCGRRRYRFRGEPAAAGFCHCTMCRRATGGPFAFLVRVEAQTLEWLGERPATYRSSPIAQRGFCPRCGTPLFLDYDDDAYIRLTGGTLDQAENVRPEYHYGVESRLCWFEGWQDLPDEETKERL